MQKKKKKKKKKKVVVKRKRLLNLTKKNCCNRQTQQFDYPKTLIDRRRHLYLRFSEYNFLLKIRIRSVKNKKKINKPISFFCLIFKSIKKGRL